ncbi:MAG TPA: hypothetical protein VMG10_02075 [Gemmataceae bacterium]|nr:hypothetical protein [Gemmataceae bacterium]
MRSVPDFFQDESEDALRSQVEWLQQHLGLGDSFFVGFLREDARVFAAWRSGSALLGVDQQEILRAWWRAALHLLSFQNFDEIKVRSLLERVAPAHPQSERSPFSPPWVPSSLKEHLQTQGAEAIPEVERWLESFRFGDPYASSGKGSPCLSTQP